MPSSQETTVLSRPAEPDAANGAQDTALPNRVSLSYAPARIQAAIPASVTLSAAAQSAIALTPPAIQRELFRVLDTAVDQALPGLPGLFVAKSKSGYRMTYQRDQGRKLVIDVFSPELLERVGKHKTNG